MLSSICCRSLCALAWCLTIHALSADCKSRRHCLLIESRAHAQCGATCRPRSAWDVLIYSTSPRAWRANEMARNSTPLARDEYSSYRLLVALPAMLLILLARGAIMLAALMLRTWRLSVHSVDELRAHSATKFLPISTLSRLLLAY